jgi:hypothetical protein
MTTIVGHLSSDELEARYEAAADPVAKSHFHGLWLLSCGYEVEEVAEILSFSLRWVRALLKRYNEGGAEALGDQRIHPQRNQADHPDARGAGGSQGEDQGATGGWRAFGRGPRLRAGLRSSTGCDPSPTSAGGIP